MWHNCLRNLRKEPMTKAKGKVQLVTERTSQDGVVYDFRCPYPKGCGATASGGDPFSSTGWADRQHAVDRGKQHVAEHEGTPMPSLHEFRVARGLTADTAGSAVKPDDWEF
jgi:hypothetical protein